MEDTLNEETFGLESRTVTKYKYDENCMVIEETKESYYRLAEEEANPVNEVFAVATVAIPHGDPVPEGYVIADKSHIYMKHAVYVKLPPIVVTATEEQIKKIKEELEGVADDSEATV